MLMAELQRKDATTSLRKKSPSIDEDFGKDFLYTWKSSKGGKDALDFDIETVPQNAKKSFNFDKFDDFGLDSGFDKLPSFKMDMSDLDFSAPLNKLDKANEMSGNEILAQKQDKEKDKFSFSFDFNDLDKFDLDAKSVKVEKKAKSSTDDVGPDKHDHDKDLDLKCDSSLKNKTLESNKTSSSSKAENITTFQPILPDEAEADGQSTFSNKARHEMPQDIQRAQDNRVTAKEADKRINVTVREHQYRTEKVCSKPHAVKTADQFALLSVSSKPSAKTILPQISKDTVSSNFMKTSIINEQDNGLKMSDASQSRSSSPVSSYNSKSCVAKSKIGSPDTGSGFQKYKDNQTDVTEETGSGNESTSGHADGKRCLVSNVRQSYLKGIKSISERKDSSSMLLSSPISEEFKSFKFMPSKEKSALDLQIKPLSKPEGSTSQLTSDLDGLPGINIDTHAYPADGKRESNSNDEHTDTAEEKIGIEAYHEEAVITTASVASENGRYVNHRGTSSAQLNQSNLKQATIRVPRLTFSLKLSPKVNSSGSQDGSQYDEGRHVKPCLKTLSLKSRMLKDNSSAKSSKVSAISESILSRNAVDSDTSGQHDSMIPPSKRKMMEEPVTDQRAMNPLKRFNRMPPDVPLPYNSEIVPQKGSPEAAKHHISANVINSIANAAENGNTMDLELPVLIENDGIVEKAEACSKELDDICNMLKRKHDEAKELLVRAVVNNNTLLMLNHPMIEEKIRALQRFATSLQSKEHWKS